jgi:hypothetical protein
MTHASVSYLQARRLASVHESQRGIPNFRRLDGGSYTHPDPCPDRLHFGCVFWQVFRGASADHSDMFLDSLHGAAFTAVLLVGLETGPRRFRVGFVCQPLPHHAIELLVQTLRRLACWHHNTSVDNDSLWNGLLHPAFAYLPFGRCSHWNLEWLAGTPGQLHQGEGKQRGDRRGARWVRRRGPCLLQSS